MKSMFTKANLIRGFATSTAALLVMSGAAQAALTFGSATVTGAVLTLDSTTTGAVNLGTGASAKTVTIGNATGASDLDLLSGTGDITVTSTDDVTINGGSAGSLINIGTNTDGNVFHIGDNDTTADTITIGSAKDTSSLAGIAVTVGSTGTTSALTLQSGTGDLLLTSTDDITVTMLDNGADGLDIQEGTNNYLNINTTNSSENISLGNATTNPSFSFLGSGSATLAGRIIKSTNTALTATVGGAQAGIALSKDINFVTTVASTGDSAQLPVAVIGMDITIINRGANSMNVFGQTGDGINAGGANAAYAVAANVEARCIAVAASGATAWECQKSAR